jgi:hypothetical protein
VLTQLSLFNSAIAKITMVAMNTTTPDQAHTTASAIIDSHLFGHDSDWWTWWMLASLVAAALVAAFVAVTTTGLVVVQKREAIAAKSELDRYKLTVDGRIADARAEGIAAGKVAGDATVKAAEANQAAGEANERAAKAELELAKYRAGRSVTPAQHAILVEWLRKSPKGRVVVKPNFLASEPTRLANQISAAFNEAGFVGVGDAYLSGIVSYNRPGLFLAVRDASKEPPQTEPILKAFFEAGIPIESGHGDWVPDDTTVVILVSEQP